MFPIRNGQRFYVYSSDGSVTVVQSGGVVDLSVPEPALPGWDVVLELDFSAEPSATYSPDGVYALAGINWTTQGVATSRGVLQNINGTGLSIQQLNVISALNASTDTAPSLRAPLSSVIPDYDPGRRYVVQAHVASFGSTTTTSDRVGIGLFGPSGSPTSAAQRFIAAAFAYGGTSPTVRASPDQNSLLNPQTGRPFGSTAGNYNVLELDLGPALDPQTRVGLYTAGAWPARTAMRVVTTYDPQTLTTEDPACYNDPSDNYFVIYTGKAGTTPTSTPTAIIPRVRILRAA